jgi:hypothetical protein
MKATVSAGEDGIVVSIRSIRRRASLFWILSFLKTVLDTNGRYK